MKKSLINILNKGDGILRLTLDDEHNKNALSEAMINELIKAITSSINNKSIKVIIIASNGNVFCSGHNLKEITLARNNKDKGDSYFTNLFQLCSSLMQLIVDCPMPVIAEVRGIATAAGCQLVASCDLAISSNTAKFATPGVKIGLFCSTPLVALSRNLSRKDAMKMLLTGDMVDASEAKRISLINDYLPEKELSKFVTELALKIANKSSKTIRLGKELFYRQLEMDLSSAYKYSSKVMAKNTLRDDAIEGISSFLEKRKPNWKD